MTSFGLFKGVRDISISVLSSQNRIANIQNDIIQTDAPLVPKPE